MKAREEKGKIGRSGREMGYDDGEGEEKEMG